MATKPRDTQNIGKALIITMVIIIFITCICLIVTGSSYYFNNPWNIRYETSLIFLIIGCTGGGIIFIISKKL